MYRFALLAAALIGISGCQARPDPNAVTMLIESSPTNLDPRIGTDAQSEHIDELLFDALVERDEHFNIHPSLATSWDWADPTTLVFHLRSGVRFHDGRPLTSRDVKWTLDSIRIGTITTAKAGSFPSLDHVDAPDSTTVVFHLKLPDSSLLANLSSGAIGIVPEGSGKDFWQHPVGSGPFRFVRQQIDNEVVIERNPDAWRNVPKVSRVRFAVVPDAITRALELEKGSADIAASNTLTVDMVYALRNRKDLIVESGPGTVLNYLTFNTRDAILKDKRVRQAMALAINRPLIVQTLWRGHARLASSLLPPQHWAWSGDVATYDYDPARATQLLDASGYKRQSDGYRFHLAMKTSTDETSRLLAAILQQQLRQVGIALEIRSFEFATFYADIVRGAFQMYSLRWVGGNEQPDIFSYAFSTSRFPPKGANRGHYSNAEVDRLLNDATRTYDQRASREDYVRVQRILAEELPAINLWYLDTIIVHNRRLENISLSPSGDYEFLREVSLSR